VRGVMVLTSGGEISSSTFGIGNAGGVSVQAGTLVIDGAGSSQFTGITSSSYAFTTGQAAAGGNAGSVSVNVDGAITLLGAGEIVTETYSLGNAGAITVHAGSLTINGSAAPDYITGIDSSSYGPTDDQGYPIGGSGGNAGSVTVNVDGLLSILGAGEIVTDTYCSGNAGDINVRAASLDIDGSVAPGFLTGIASDSDSPVFGSLGRAGAVSVSVSGAATIVGGGSITADTYTSGNAGDVTVQAGSLLIDGSLAQGYYTGISSNTGGASFTSLGTGNAGRVTIMVAGALVLRASGEIDTDTYSFGNAGNLTVHAGSLTIDGSEEPNEVTGISSESDGALDANGNPTGVGGNAGTVSVDVNGALLLTGSGEIDTDTFSSGNAGDVIVNAGTLSIDGSATPDYFTGISSDSNGSTDAQGYLTGEGGNAGLVSITVSGSLAITGGGFISSSTQSSGNGGDIIVNAGSLLIDGTSLGYKTGILGNSYADATGSAGDVNVFIAGGLTIVNGGRISASTFGYGNGGDLRVSAGSFDVDGSGTPDQFTGIIAESIATGISGKAGTITLTGGPLTLSGRAEVSSSSLGSGVAGGVSIASTGDITLDAGSSIDASAANSTAGSLSVTTPGSLSLNGSFISTSAGLDGGNITLNVGRLVYLLNSQITTEALGGAATSGGNITIDPEFVVLNNSLIDADDPLGTGGNISITSDYFFSANSLVTASGATHDGSVTISAPELDLAGNLLALPDELVDEQKKLREQCARSLNHEFSSLIVVGRGGVETPPDELQSDFGDGPSSYGR
jgi:hypothetical protein